MRNVRFNPRHLSAVVLLSLAACGGGGGGDEPPNDGSTVTRADLQSCPTNRMSPVKMDQLSCLVGTYTGTTTLDTAGQTPARPCSVEVKADGSVTLIDGDMVHTHTLSGGTGTYQPTKTETSFAEYTGRKAAVDENGAPMDGMEGLRFGTTSGTVRADGTDIPGAQWTDLQLMYVGAVAGHSGIAIATFTSFNGVGPGKRVVVCNARL